MATGHCSRGSVHPSRRALGHIHCQAACELSPPPPEASPSMSVPAGPPQLQNWNHSRRQGLPFTRCLCAGHANRITRHSHCRASSLRDLHTGFPWHLPRRSTFRKLQETAAAATFSQLSANSSLGSALAHTSEDVPAFQRRTTTESSQERLEIGHMWCAPHHGLLVVLARYFVTRAPRMPPSHVVWHEYRLSAKLDCGVCASKHHTMSL